MSIKQLFKHSLFLNYQKESQKSSSKKGKPHGRHGTRSVKFQALTTTPFFLQIFGCDKKLVADRKWASRSRAEGVRSAFIDVQLGKLSDHTCPATHGVLAIRHFWPKCQWPSFILTVLKNSPGDQEVYLLFKKKCNDAPCRLFVVNTSSVCMIIIACTLRTYHCNVGFGWAPLLETALHPIARPGWKREHNEDFLSRAEQEETQRNNNNFQDEHQQCNLMHLTPFLCKIIIVRNRASKQCTYF